MSTPIVVLGSGGHAKVVLDLLLQLPQYSVAGLIDRNTTRWQTALFGVPVLGDDSILPSLRARGITHCALGIGSVGDATVRRALFTEQCARGFTFPLLVHPAATISRFAELSAGTVAFAHAVVNPGAFVGQNVILNTGVIVEHDCWVDDHAHLAPRACLAGNVRVGQGAHIGLGAIVRQGVTIGTSAIVGAGAVVVHDVPAGITVIGVPARPYFREGKHDG